MTSSKQNNFYQTILEDASDKAASLGLLTRSPNQQEINNPKIANIAGLTLKPSPLPEKAYKLAIKNEPIWHKLYTNIVSNKFKNEIPKLLSDVQEDFIEKLLISREKIEKNKFNQIGRLQFYRNDYMVDKDGGLKQIELNTIAISVLVFAEGIKKLHEYVREKIEFTTKESERPEFFSKDKGNLKKAAIDENLPLSNFIKNFEIAHELYKSKSGTKNSPLVLFVVEDQRYNIHDMRKIEYQLNNSNIHSIFKTFKQLNEPNVMKVDQNNGTLYIDGFEISIVYFRTGYNPDSYESENAYEIRENLEISRAIKCPSLDFQLLTFKRIQIELSSSCCCLDDEADGETGATNFDDCGNPIPLQENILAKFLELPSDHEHVKSLESTFVKIYQACKKAPFNLAINNPDKYVLKEQREGGTEILTGIDVKNKLIKVDKEEGHCGLCKWVIMERIRPEEFKMLSTRQVDSCSDNENDQKEFAAVSELGIYSATVEDLTQEDADDSDSKRLLNSQVCGYLLRSKGRDKKSGGFATGVASCDDFYFV